ncbi:MAG: hypothetical protein R2794_13210 [Chitinophagales bacterium]
MKQQCVGVWLDHSIAHVIVQIPGAYEMYTLHSPYKRQVRIPGESSDKTKFGKSASNNEKKKHNSKQNDLDTYFKQLEELLIRYKHILLFGPTEAKNMLYNLLCGNKKFENKLIEVQNADKMTENQMIAYVRDYFEPAKEVVAKRKARVLN